jgi:hypothetical protein
MDGLFEQPVGYSGAVTMYKCPKHFCKTEFFRILLEFPCQPINHYAGHFCHYLPSVL